MLPPKYPRSPRDVIKYDEETQQIPYPNNQLRFSNSRQKYRSSGISSLDSKSRVSKYEHLRTPQQKRKALGKRRYINQLAYLDYEDKHIEIHTKYTMASKVSAMKKIKAKNQMAQFIEEQQEQQVGFEQLMDYKYGPQSNNENFFFQKNELISEYKFCPFCDSIHNDHPQVHDKICRDKILSGQDYDIRNQFYVYLSLQRIQNSLKRTSGQQYDSLKQIVKNLVKIQEKNFNQANNQLNIQANQLQRNLKYLYELLNVNQNDKMLRDIVQKIIKQLYKRNLR